MVSILEQIVREKKNELRAARKKVSLTTLKRLVKKKAWSRRNFKASISPKDKIGFIGELKIASPVKGYLCRNLNLVKTARLFERMGINAVSVLTDKHFKGRLNDIKKVRKTIRLPILRKDFIIGCYQLYESYLAGADAVLLIASILSKKKLSYMLDILRALKMDALIEVHSFCDLKKIPMDDIDIIGINNRRLTDFKIDLSTTKKIIKKIPKGKIIVSESGISSRQDIIYLKDLGVNAVLIGEGIVAANNIKRRIAVLKGNWHDKN